MAQPTNDGATDQFMSSTGQILRHECTLPPAHNGNHVCGCGAQWPRRNLQWEAWHGNQPRG